MRERVRSVAVDLECALATKRAGMELGHIGHLVQIERRWTARLGSLRPGGRSSTPKKLVPEAAAASARPDASSTSSRAFAERMIDSIAAMKAGFQLPKSSQWPRLWITFRRPLRWDYDLPGVAVRRRESHGEADAESRTLRQASETLARFGYRGSKSTLQARLLSVTLEALAEADATEVEPGHGADRNDPAARERRPA